MKENKFRWILAVILVVMFQVVEFIVGFDSTVIMGIALIIVELHIINDKLSRK